MRKNLRKNGPNHSLLYLGTTDKIWGKKWVWLFANANGPNPSLLYLGATDAWNQGLSSLTNPIDSHWGLQSYSSYSHRFDPFSFFSWLDWIGHHFHNVIIFCHQISWWGRSLAKVYSREMQITIMLDSLFWDGGVGRLLCPVLMRLDKSQKLLSCFWVVPVTMHDWTSHLPLFLPFWIHEGILRHLKLGQKFEKKAWSGRAFLPFWFFFWKN